MQWSKSFSKEKINFYEEIFSLPVWDTHTHLDLDDYMSAREFWNIAHYFWFHRELVAVGYPEKPEEVKEKERIKLFLKAFEKNRNTYWSRAFKIIFRDLFNVKEINAKSIHAINEVLKETSESSTWGKKVCKRLNIQKIVASKIDTPGLKKIDKLMFRIPLLHTKIPQHVDQIKSAKDQRAKTEKILKEIIKEINDFAEKGLKNIRIFPVPFNDIVLSCPVTVPKLKRSGNSESNIQSYLWHKILEVLNEKQFTVQIFIGMVNRPSLMLFSSLNKTDRIFNLHAVFEKYPNITFEVVNAAELSALDIVQSARIFRNVCPGGLWWFNFRASNYRMNMQYRLEALAACRSVLIASDARHIEWSYGKIYFVKELLAEFLFQQIKDGWLDKETALFTAKNWLYDSAKLIYS